MAFQLKQNPEMFNLFSIDEYIDLITDFIAMLRPDIIIERFISESPTDLLLAPKWGQMKNFEIVNKIDKKMIEKNLWQGKYYSHQEIIIITVRLDEQANIRKEKSFFETRVTEYQAGGLNWD